MRYSLLYNKTDKTPTTEQRGGIREAIYNLNIDRMIGSACKSSANTDYFLSVLAKPLTDVEAIAYRQAIVEDLLNMPDLLDGLTDAFKGYDNLKAETEEMTGGIFRYGSGSSADAMIDCAYERAYISAHFMRTVIAYISMKLVQIL